MAQPRVSFNRPNQPAYTPNYQAGQVIPKQEVIYRPSYEQPQIVNNPIVSSQSVPFQQVSARAQERNTVNVEKNNKMEEVRPQQRSYNAGQSGKQLQSTSNTSSGWCFTPFCWVIATVLGLILLTLILLFGLGVIWGNSPNVATPVAGLQTSNVVSTTTTGTSNIGVEQVSVPQGATTVSHYTPVGPKLSQTSGTEQSATAGNKIVDQFSSSAGSTSNVVNSNT